MKNLQVVVFQSDHRIYDKGTLIQIAGRAGRKKDAPKGEVIFICKRKTNDILEAIKSIEKSNEALKKEKKSGRSLQNLHEAY